MTLPNERLRALKWAKQFLWDLLDRQKTKRVPLAIRKMARSIAKHYPNDYELDEIADKCPKLLEKETEK